MDNKFIEKIEIFFGQNQIKDGVTLSFVREDGIILYSNFPNELQAKSIGALVAGVWQAARSLASFTCEKDEEDFTLSYNTSSDGIVTYPISYDQKTYFLCGIYQEELNPAVIKQKLKLLQGKLLDFLIDNIEAGSQIREGFLFDDISDDEMDGLFTVMGN